MLDKDIKSKIIKDFSVGESDTGSSHVQIALLSARIRQIADHLKSFPKILSGSTENQASADSFLNKSATFKIISFYRRASPHFLQKKAGILTPHLRCLEIHQSGLSLTAANILSSLCGGYHLLLRTTSRAFFLKSS